MLFAVDPERCRPLQIRPFRGYDADQAVACIRVTRNDPELSQYAEATGRGLRVEAMRATAGERRAQLAPGGLSGTPQRPEDPGDRLPRGSLSPKHAERELPLGFGEERMEEARPGLPGVPALAIAGAEHRRAGDL